MAFTGDLKSISLSDIFQNLSQNERTGRLRIEGTDAFDIGFRRGKVAAVARPGEAVDEVLYGVLRNRGTVTPEELNRVRKKVRPPAGPVAAALRMKLITKRDAEELLAYYLHERVLDAFSLDAGTFEFLEGEEHLEGWLAEWSEHPQNLDPSRLFFEAARRDDEWARIRKKIISEDEIFTPCLNIRESVREGIDGEDLEIFVLVDGLRTLREVVEASRETKFVVWGSVSRLLEKGMIRPLQVNQTLRLAEKMLAEENHAKCIEVARKGLSVERNHPALRHVLALALSRSGEETQAAEELKLLALSHLDEDDPRRAKAVYREVVEIVPSDVDARQRIFDLTVSHGSREEVLAEGKGFVEALRSFGLNARAREVLGRLVDLSPDDLDLLDAYAEVSLDTGDKAEAVKTYHLMGERLREEGRLAEARTLYARVTEAAPEDERARQRLAELEEDVFREKEKRRRVVRRAAVAAAIALLALAWLAYDFAARSAYVETQRSVAVALAAGDWNGALAELEAFRQDHPYTTLQAASRRYGWSLRVLACLEKARESRAAGRRSEALQWIDEAETRARAHLDEDDPLLALVAKRRQEFR